MLYSFTSESKLRLDDFLRVQIPIALADSVSNEQISNSKIRRLIVAGAVSVNGQQCRRPAFELRGRSIVKVELDPQKFFYEKQPDDISYEVTSKDVIFEDEYLICVNLRFFQQRKQLSEMKNGITFMMRWCAICGRRILLCVILLMSALCTVSTGKPAV